MKKIALLSGISSFFVPFVVMAQNANTTYINNWIIQIKDWLSTAIVMLMVLMTLYFLWNVFKFIAEKDPTKIKDRKQSMINGIIGLFVAVSVWGIIRIAGGILGTQGTSSTNYNPPCPPGMVYVGSPFNQCR